MSDKPMRRREAAAWLTEQGYPVRSATLAKYATVGGGPEFVSYGRFPLYTPDNLLKWALARCSGPKRSTSDSGTRAA